MSEEVQKMGLFSLFQQTAQTLDQAEAKAKSEKGFEKIDRFRTPEEGEYVVRVLPLAPTGVDSEGKPIMPMDRNGFEFQLYSTFLDIDQPADKKGKVKMDARSEDKGCEPENVTTGIVGDKRYAFVGLERTSGVAVFDITGIESGNAPKLEDFYLDPKDRGPEGILFIPAEKSPNGEPLLVVGYEYSKTLAVYSVK